MFILDTVSCGGITGIPEMLPNLVSVGYNIIKIFVPIALILFGMWDLGKAVMQQKEDDIKKGQKTFIQRVIAAVIVFLVFSIVQLVFGLLASASGDDSENIMDCVNCFLDSSKCSAD